MTRRSAARRGAVASACAGFLWLAGSGLCDAAERTWTFTGNAFFSDATRWSPNAVPGAADNARFNLANTYSILFATNPTNTLASVTDGDVTFSLAGETYTLTSTGATSLVVGSKSSFPAVLGKLTVSGGTLSDQSASIGNGLFEPGQVTVGGGSWTNANTLSLGLGTTGTMFVNAGGFVSCTDAVFGENSGITGNATIGGAGATWTVNSLLDVGVSGTGNVTVNTGGRLNTTVTGTDAALGDAASGKGTVNVAGGTWTSSTAVRIGNAGAGSLNVSSGTVACGNIYLGYNAGAAGSLNVTGGLIDSSGSMFVGGNSSAAGGTGQVNISAGTLSVASELRIRSGGTVALNGGYLTIGSLTLAGGTVNWSSGTLSVAAGLSVSPTGVYPSLTLDANRNFRGGILLGDATGAGTMNVLGGVFQGGLQMDHQSVFTSVGSHNFVSLIGAVPSGTASITGGTVDFGDAAPSTRYRSIGTNGQGARVDLSNATWVAPDSDQGLDNTLNIGDGATGTLTLTNGCISQQKSMDIVLGGSGNSSGALLIDASTWTDLSSDFPPLATGTIVIGRAGHGWLTIQNAGQFQSAKGGTIGLSAGSVGTVTVSGAGSEWDVSGGSLIVGQSGAATLNVSAGAHVVTTQGSLAQSLGSSASVLVDGGTLTLTQDLFVGASGAASLMLIGGGQLQCHNSHVGSGTNGTGTVTISGIGSAWTVGVPGAGGTLFVGNGGAGTVILLAGGAIGPIDALTPTDCFIGASGSSPGTVLVSGGSDLGVRFLRLGLGAEGTLTISNGGSVSCISSATVGGVGGAAGGTVVVQDPGSMWTCDSINLGLSLTSTVSVSAGGTVAANEIDVGTVGLLSVNAGSINAGSINISGTGRLSDNAGTIAASGSITVSGGGTLSYSNGGTISASLLGLQSSTLSGSGMFSVPIAGTNATIDVPSGTLTLAASVSNAFLSTLTKTGVGTLTLTNLAQTGTGTLLISDGTLNVNTDLGPGLPSVTVGITQSGSALNFRSSQHLTALNVSGGRAVLLPGGNKVLVTTSLLIDPADAQLDLTDNDMIVDYSGATPLTMIAGYLHSGFAGGSWLGNGITSASAASVAADGSNHHKTALGYADASTLNVSSFFGQSVDATSVLVRYTLAGDANLDGAVNTLDFTALANHLNQTGTFWSDGDFNYDGVVNALDFNAVATNYGATLPSPPALGAFVPEPTAVALATFAVFVLAPRRRR